MYMYLGILGVKLYPQRCCFDIKLPDVREALAAATIGLATGIALRFNRHAACRRRKQAKAIVRPTNHSKGNTLIISLQKPFLLHYMEFTSVEPKQSVTSTICIWMVLLRRKSAYQIVRKRTSAA